jgi:hypothetical protein
MNSRPPVAANRQKLPFQDSAFGWDTFEDFFRDFLNAQPEIVLPVAGEEIRQRVICARPFGRKGDSQHGIDLVAEMEGGEVWDFQCKHYKEWGPQNTRDAVSAYNRDAARRFLLITREVSEKCFEVIAQLPHWELWDAREINQRFRDSIDVAKAARILFTHFGPGWAEAFFGIAGDGPLIGAEAKFERHLRCGIRFHHRHALIGRRARSTKPSNASPISTLPTRSSVRFSTPSLRTNTYRWTRIAEDIWFTSRMNSGQGAVQSIDAVRGRSSSNTKIARRPPAPIRHYAVERVWMRRQSSSLHKMKLK